MAALVEVVAVVMVSSYPVLVFEIKTYIVPFSGGKIS